MSDFNPGLALTLIAFLLAAPAQAAEIKIDAEQRFLVVEGRLVLEDFETFKTKAAQISGGARVFLTSEGGSIAAGIEIGLTSEQDPINTLGACCRPRRKA